MPKNPDRQDTDIFTRSQVAEALGLIRKEFGWSPADEKELLESFLDDQHVLVRTLRSPQGRKFLSKVGSRDLLIDRLDRISTVPGGPQLIQSLVSLPDGEKYAKPVSGGGVPDLLDLLPKSSSGATRKIANYDQPTGRFYTFKGFVARLQRSIAKSPPAKATVIEASPGGVKDSSPVRLPRSI